MKPTCLFVRPALSGEANGGDSVVYRRVEAYLRERCELTVLELDAAGRARQLVGVAAGLPLEPARYATSANQQLLDSTLAAGGHDLVVYGHEAVFPLGLKASRTTRRAFYAHNIQSGVSAGGETLVDRIVGPSAVRFDRRWTADPADWVVCISRHDVSALARIGVTRSDILLVPPGAPPAAPLVAAPQIRPEIVLTGSYGWWRKRNDLRSFADEPALPYPLLVSDPLALELLGAQASAIDPKTFDWSGAIRPAVVTDRFLGGFKLKTLEYVALNCAVFSFCDVRAEFQGLPHAEEFVRFIGSKSELGALVAAFAAQPPTAVAERFRAFKAACLDRYAWESCLAPLDDILAA